MDGMLLVLRLQISAQAPLESVDTPVGMPSQGRACTAFLGGLLTLNPDILNPKGMPAGTRRGMATSRPTCRRASASQRATTSSSASAGAHTHHRHFRGQQVPQVLLLRQLARLPRLAQLTKLAGPSIMLFQGRVGSRASAPCWASASLTTATVSCLCLSPLLGPDFGLWLSNCADGASPDQALWWPQQRSV